MAPLRTAAGGCDIALNNSRARRDHRVILLRHCLRFVCVRSSSNLSKRAGVGWAPRYGVGAHVDDEIPDGITTAQSRLTFRQCERRK